MGGSIGTGSIFGIQLRWHYSWFIIFLVVTIGLSHQYFPDFYPNWSYWSYWVAGVVTSLLFFLSVLAHEIAHSLVARRSGILVKT
ncbi:hypothetical protein ACFLXC_02555 [Chloroflexota bacterium]